MSAFGRASASSAFTFSPISVGSSVGSVLGPRCQPSATASSRPDTWKMRPVTPAESVLASHVTMGAIQRGEKASLASSSSCPMPRPSVMRVRAPGAMALAVTP